MVLEKEPSSSVLLNGEADPEFEKLSEVHISRNIRLWKSTYPSARMVLLDTSHFGLLQTRNLSQLEALLDD